MYLSKSFTREFLAILLQMICLIQQSNLHWVKTLFYGMCMCYLLQVFNLKAEYIKQAGFTVEMLCRIELVIDSLNSMC